MQDQSTPLHWAATQGHVEVAKALLAKGANVNAINEVWLLNDDMSFVDIRL